MNVRDKIFRKANRILLLSVLILILGLIFFFWRGKTILQNDKTHEINLESLTPGFTAEYNNLTVNDSTFKNSPDPNKFSKFNFPETKKIIINTNCNDIYYAVLIFLINDDYRQKPNSFKFNRAYPCTKNQIIQQEIDLNNINLTPDQYYYFVADQSEIENWYNPR